MHRTPSYVAARLAAFARANEGAIDGRLLLAGLNGGFGGLTLRQVCNVSYVIQLEGKNDVDAQKFELELNQPPPGWARRGPIRSRVDPGLLALMGGKG